MYVKSSVTFSGIKLSQELAVAKESAIILGNILRIKSEFLILVEEKILKVAKKQLQTSKKSKYCEKLFLKGVRGREGKNWFNLLLKQELRKLVRKDSKMFCTLFKKCRIFLNWCDVRGSATSTTFITSPILRIGLLRGRKRFFFPTKSSLSLKLSSFIYLIVFWWFIKRIAWFGSKNNFKNIYHLIRIVRRKLNL